MERGLDLSRHALASLSQIPSDVVNHVERDGEPYALSLAQNRLTQLRELHVFKNVLQLDLSGNLLQSLDGIEALRSLENLNVAHNRLTTIDALVALPKLRVLNAAENNLTHLDALRQMKSIVAVDISYNNISKWPQLSQLTALESIDLSSNELEAFPVSVAVRMLPRSLKRLLLAKNRIQELCGIAALGMFLQKLETIKVDGNPAVQRILREGGCFDFLWVNLFASVSFAKGQGVRRDDFVVPPDVRAAVEDAVQQGDEALLSQFLVTGAVPVQNVPPPVFQTPSYHSMTSRGPESEWNDRYKMDETSQASRFYQQKTPSVENPVAQLLPPPPPAPSAQLTENGSNGLSKESKMELWKRMMSERKGPEQRATPPMVRSTPAKEPITPKTPPDAHSNAAITAPVAYTTPPAPSHRTDPKVGSTKPPSPPTPTPAASLDPMASQLKTLNEQVMGMRKYVKVWVKREQLVREAAAKRIQRFIRRRQWKLHLSFLIQQSQSRRRREYGVEHFSSEAAARMKHVPPQQLHLHVYAIVIQRHVRGWLMRFRVSRWMYYTQAAEKIQVIWRRRRGQRVGVKRDLGLLHSRTSASDQGSRFRASRTEQLENAVAMLATDVRQLQRVFVVQEQVIARQSRELAHYKRFVELALESPVVKLQSLWRGYYARRESATHHSRHSKQATASKQNGEVAALRAEVGTLKVLVQSLLAKSAV